MEKNNVGFLEKRFKLKENHTSPKVEIMAGVTTFMTMSYILAVNPDILSKTGMNKGAVFTATILASILATVLMAFLANYPFVLSAGMGLNAYFAFTVVLDKGHNWEFALTAVFLEGIIFILMSLFKIRESIFNAIPRSLKNAVSVGIGLFIALIGLHNGQIVKSGEGTILSLDNLKSPGAAVTIFGLILIGVLIYKKVKGALLFGILGSTILAGIIGVTKFPHITGLVSLPPSIAPVAFKLEFHNILTLEMLITVFAFLFVDVFDTIGTLVGVSTKAKMLNEKGELPKLGSALMADAIGTTAGALIGTSTITTFVESASGVTEGGRTGLTALTSAGLFALSLFLFPIFGMIPSQATAPALIIVGLFMMTPIQQIDFTDYTEAIPAFLTIVMMPFAYSIAQGIVFGMVSYVVLKILTGKHKDVSPIMYILALLFLGSILLG